QRRRVCAGPPDRRVRCENRRHARTRAARQGRRPRCRLLVHRRRRSDRRRHRSSGTIGRGSVMQLENAKAVVSGGASGLGLATAKRVVAAGGRVTLLDLNEEQGAKSAAELGPAARFVRTDVADEAAVQAAVREAADLMDGITLAVNCAGILLPARVLGREGPLPAASFERSLKVNLLGTFILIKEAANVMQHNEPNDDGERGVIVNT